MAKSVRQSAGILLYHFLDNKLQVLLVHNGGPFWANKDLGTWTIPKGEFGEDETALLAAIREFKEETGYELKGDFKELNPIVQKGGKKVYAWAIEGQIDAEKITCNTFKMEWPPKSGKWQDFPEVDKAEWFFTNEARQKINVAQIALINELEEKVLQS